MNTGPLFTYLKSSIYSLFLSILLVTWQWSLSKRVISLKCAVDCTLGNKIKGGVYWLFEGSIAAILGEAR